MTPPSRKTRTDTIDRLLVASDGSGDHPRDARKARAGWALTYAKGHPWNDGAPLGGQIQSVPRAELRAVYPYQQRADVPSICLCDCLGVARGMQTILRGGSVRGRDHWGLWGPLQDGYLHNPLRTDQWVQEVKAHLAWKDVVEGRIPAEEWVLNALVGDDAKKRGKTRRPPPEMLNGTYRRIGVTVLVQCMMVRILGQRHRALEIPRKRFSQTSDKGRQ